MTEYDRTKRPHWRVLGERMPLERDSLNLLRGIVVQSPPVPIAHHQGNPPGWRPSPTPFRGASRTLGIHRDAPPRRAERGARYRGLRRRGGRWRPPAGNAVVPASSYCIHGHHPWRGGTRVWSAGWSAEQPCRIGSLAMPANGTTSTDASVASLPRPSSRARQRHTARSWWPCRCASATRGRKVRPGSHRPSSDLETCP